MEGIDAIQRDEAHRKRLKHLCKNRERMLPRINSDQEAYTFCEDEKCICIQEIQENFIKNGRVPQIVDIEVFKQTY